MWIPWAPPGPLAPWGPKKGMGPKKMHKKGSHFIKKWRFWEVVQVPRKYLFDGVICRKTNWFHSSWDGALAFKTIRGATWRPKDQFGGIWWSSEFPIFPKNMNIDFPHAMPNPKSHQSRGNRIVWSMPCPWTPLDLPNTISNCEINSFCETIDFSVFLWP